MTPLGRFKFLLAPFGMCSTSEHYNGRMSEAFKGLTNYRKIVDNVIPFDEDKRTHAAHVRQFLQKCINKGIYLHKEKFKLCQIAVNFASCQISQEACKIDDGLLTYLR